MIGERRTLNVSNASFRTFNVSNASFRASAQTGTSPKSL